ncbi:MAG TPA: hypothetical protein VE869_03440 [Gemmatimonas sp.]|nr:hypothetical protein [Gemmatimonas sp.]
MARPTSSPAAIRRHQIARALLMDAPIFKCQEVWVDSIRRQPDIDYGRLLARGTWCTGEQLVLEAAAAIDGRPIDGTVLSVSLDELAYRLDAENYVAVRDAVRQLSVT